MTEGQRLYNWYNCGGCHFRGGGGIGPALMDEVWIYGKEPANLYASILGRPPQRDAVLAGKDPRLPDLADRHLRAVAQGQSRHRRASRPPRGAPAGGRRQEIAVKRAVSRAAVLALLTAACQGRYVALDPASPEASRINDLHWLMFWVTGAVSVVVVGLLAAAVPPPVGAADAGG
jgi:hypothetical protein